MASQGAKLLVKQDTDNEFCCSGDNLAPVDLSHQENISVTDTECSVSVQNYQFLAPILVKTEPDSPKTSCEDYDSAGDPAYNDDKAGSTTDGREYEPPNQRLYPQVCMTTVKEEEVDGIQEQWGQVPLNSVIHSLSDSASGDGIAGESQYRDQGICPEGSVKEENESDTAEEGAERFRDCNDSSSGDGAGSYYNSQHSYLGKEHEQGSLSNPTAIPGCVVTEKPVTHQEEGWISMPLDPPCHETVLNYSSRAVVTYDNALDETETFECEHCEKVFRHKNALKVHLRTHTSTGQLPHECQICSERFEDHERLKVHLLSHSGEKPFECSLCGAGFTRKSARDRHVRSQHLKDYKCEHCDYRCGSIVLLKRHSSKHQESTITCPYCERLFKRTEDVEYHIKRMHSVEKPYKCDQCGFSSGLESALKRHMKKHRVIYQCPSCDLILPNAFKLKIHERVHQAPKDSGAREIIKNFVCLTCGKRFRDRSQLIAHSASHSSEKPFMCEVCGKAFKCELYLQRHSKNHHGNNPTAEQHCPLCLVQVSTRRLPRHMQKHYNVGMDMCPVCFRKCTTNISLELHKYNWCHYLPGRTDAPVSQDQEYPLSIEDASLLPLGLITGPLTVYNPKSDSDETDDEVQDVKERQKRLKQRSKLHSSKKIVNKTCHICNKVMKHQGSYWRHLRLHKEHLPHQCNICGQRFLMERMVRKHSMIHQSEKYFRCEICQTSFRQLGNLKRHLMRNKPCNQNANFPCEICGEIFESNFLLTSHIQGSHKVHGSGS